jgi:D-serine deaminase-like pyridoxal phosphate-dependent protein
MDLTKIKKPTLLLDEARCRRNIMNMAEKASLSCVVFRPHFKTHQSIEIGSWFSEEEVSAITVSSITMAEHFADAGWKDITIAFPLNLREVEDAELLSYTINLNILVSDIQQAAFLSARPKLNAGCFIEIDTGNMRSGIDWNDQIQLIRMMDTINSSHSIRFMGFLTHSGHTYKSKSVGDN